MRRAVLAIALLAACRTVVGPADPPAADPTEAWGRLLAAVVTPDGLVDYDRLEAERDTVEDYLGWVAQGRVPRTKDGEAAFWLNARTAAVLWLVLDEGRPGSVVDVAPLAWFPGGPGVGFFRQRAFRFGLERLSIGEIDDERLRMPLQDVRVHGALWRATRTGPPLRDEPWLARRLDEQLQDQMGRWIADPVRGVRVEGDVAVFDATFADYRRDFDQWTAGDDLCTTASRFAWGEQREALEALAARGCPHRFAPPVLALDDVPR